jgi:WD40 repeat protein
MQVFSFSPDGSKLVLAVNDPAVATLFDVATARPIISFRGHENYLEAAQLTRDGTRLFTTDDEDTTLVWDVADGRIIGRLVVSKTPLELLYIQKKLRDGLLSPDEKIFAQQSDDAILLWDVSRLTGSMSALANVACNRILNDFSAGFSETELRSDPLLAARWGVGQTNTDVCNDLEGVEIRREHLDGPW